MHILITGAAGMIGRKLSARLVKDGQLNGKKIDRLTLIDVVAPEKPAGFIGTTDLSASDLSSPGAAAKAIAGRPDVIFHLAGVVSGEAETDFDKGYRVNLDGTRALLEEIRAAGYKPKVVFTSSLYAYGSRGPEPMSEADLRAVLRVDTDEWLAEIPQVEEWFAKFGDKLPAVLWSELDALKSRLNG